MKSWLPVIVLAALCLFGTGFLLGRQNPAHHFERLGSRDLFDTTTGHVCNVYPPPQDAAPPATDPYGGLDLPHAAKDEKSSFPSCNDR
jgi:hypothetical protein